MLMRLLQVVSVTLCWRFIEKGSDIFCLCLVCFSQHGCAQVFSLFCFVDKFSPCSDKDSQSCVLVPWILYLRLHAAKVVTVGQDRGG